MNQEKYNEIQPKLKELGLDITIEQLSELENILNGYNPMLMVEEGHIFFDETKSEALLTNICNLFFEENRSNETVALMSVLSAVITTMIVNSPKPDEVMAFFINEVRKGLEQKKRLKKTHLKELKIPVKPSNKAS